MKNVFYFLILLFFTSQITAFAQENSITISGKIIDKTSASNLPYVNVVLKSADGITFILGTVTKEDGTFEISSVKPENYIFEISYIGYQTDKNSLYVGSLSKYLKIPTISLQKDTTTLNEVVIEAQKNDVSNKMDKKTYSLSENVSQTGGSVLQSMQNLPGITVQDSKVQLRGNDKVTILIDGKQTAITGFGNQTGLDNIPASAIERVEIINNPSSKYDANGNAGIINIIMKKNKKEGFNGKVGLTSGFGALWIRKENLPTIRLQYTVTPKINPSITLNYRKEKTNIFFQADNLYTETLNKNEFLQRRYDDGNVINQQLKRNRDTNFFTAKTGIDWYQNDKNTFGFSTLFSSEKIIDNGDQPFFNADYSQRLRLWQFVEDELKTTVMATASYQHKFTDAGHLFNMGLNYTFHREDEKYFYDNFLPNSTGTDSFKLLSDEQVFDFNADYIQPLKYGKIETGFKLRNRNIPTNMNFIPGENSILDFGAGGKATYKELIPAVYGNYIFENEKYEAELGLRVEYVRIQYDVNPDHNTYKSSGYNYTQPFPNFRLAYKINKDNKISLFYNRRVDRPNEVDIRIFPKYDDAEIIKIGNPGLRPQFTNSVEFGFKNNWKSGYFYSAAFHRFSNGTITRISTIEPNTTLIYAVFQNAGKSFNTGLETIFSQEINKVYSFDMNGVIYRNQINAFAVNNLYPQPSFFSADKQDLISGNLKWNNNFKFSKNYDLQVSVMYLAPDIIPQGKIDQRFSLNFGIKKPIQKGKGELFINATDLLNTMVIKKEIQGNGFNYTSSDYYETQVIRFGYSYKF
jgi:outer membrane receptor protein involved in Fe transport